MRSGWRSTRQRKLRSAFAFAELMGCRKMLTRDDVADIANDIELSGCGVRESETGLLDVIVGVGGEELGGLRLEAAEGAEGQRNAARRRPKIKRTHLGWWKAAIILCEGGSCLALSSNPIKKPLLSVIWRMELLSALRRQRASAKEFEPAGYEQKTLKESRSRKASLQAAKG